jgi:hypothetical protein
VTPEQIQDLGPAFADYLRQFLFCCDYTQTFHLLGVYCRGLLSDLPRKSAEPIALASGTAVRTPGVPQGPPLVPHRRPRHPPPARRRHPPHAPR